MKREDKPERLQDMLASHLQRQPAAFDFDQWAREHPEEAQMAAQGFPKAAPRPRIQLAHIWRCIMTSRYTKLAGAAVVVLVALSFLFPSGNGIVPESIALADVQKALLEQEDARVTGTRYCFIGDDEEPTHALGVEKLFSLSYGHADRTFTEDGKLIIEFTYHIPTGTATVVFPTYKLYYRMEVPRDYRERVQRMTRDDFIEWIWASGNYRKLSPREVKGIKAVGFEVSDLPERFLDDLGIGSRIANFFVSFRSISVRMWADPKKRLPVLVEGEGEFAPCLITGYRKMRLREINDEWDFEVDLEEEKFLSEIPDDYESLSLPSARKAGPADVVASLPIALIAALRSRRRRK